MHNTIQIEFWQAILLCSMLVGGFWAVLKVAAVQYDRRQTTLEAARAEADKKRDESNKRRWDDEAAKLEDIRRHIAKLEGTQFEELRALRHSDETLRGRISQLEVQVAAMPTKADVVLIHERINEVSQAMAGLSGSFEAASDTLNLIHRKLMGGGQ